MIHLKAIHSPLTSKQHALFNRNGHFQRKKHPILCLCKPNDSDSDAPPPPPPQGDSRQQELLARIAQLQTQKVRLTDYLDERSAYLSQFAEDANAEIDQIGENALKELDEAGARVCTQLALIGLVVVGITNALISSPTDWTKSAVLGAILVGLLSQVIYEQSVLSETETKQKQTSAEEKNISKFQWQLSPPKLDSCKMLYIDQQNRTCHILLSKGDDRSLTTLKSEYEISTAYLQHKRREAMIKVFLIR